MYPPLFRRIQLATFTFLTLIVLALVISAGLTLYEQRRLRGAVSDLRRLHAFERIHVSLTEALITMQGPEPAASRARQDAPRHLAALKALATDPETHAQLAELDARIREDAPPPAPALIASLTALHRLAVIQDAGEAELLGSLEAGANWQLQLELAAPLAIIATGILLVPFARRRIIAPIEAFGAELARVADGDFSPAPADDIDPVMLPLHRRFNELVRRLDELERAHQVRAVTLQEEVRAATRQLLEQQRRLGRAERLAATGELAALVAHELRNPLAGIKMTLANLRTEIADPDLAERLDLVLAEVERLTRLLGQLLDTARPNNEPPREVPVAALVDDIFGVVRFEIPSAVKLENRVPADVLVTLPRDRLQQAILNLVLNAVAASTESGGTIVVGANLTAGRLRMSVSDEGPGFPEPVLAAGGRPFVSTRAGGTGLGLAMVRRFARDLGGDIDLANLPARGACVTVTLPMASGS
ncbi:ATP-binding protein [Candidatus Binatia bacterium]|nr:ATP-binding protein [Candidatus Binatia bacterium]